MLQKVKILQFFLQFLVACTRLYTPLCRSVGRSVGHTTFFMIFILGPYCSGPNGLVTSNMAPAHPHATLVAVYPALLLFNLCFSVSLFPFVCFSLSLRVLEALKRRRNPKMKELTTVCLSIGLRVCPPTPLKKTKHWGA